MPLTFPAHQGLILPAKLRWPDRVDATALSIGAAAPDLAYPLGSWMNRQSHTAIGLVLWAIPFAVVTALATRRWSASGIFACLPDLGPLRLRSYRVLAARNPRLLVTISSAAVGALSHVLIDSFTHAGRWGATWAGFNGDAFAIPIRGQTTWARVIQYLGHSGGTVLFVLLLVWVASSDKLSSWYSPDAIRSARSTVASPPQIIVFFAFALTPVLMAVALSERSGIDNVFLAQTILVPSLVIAGAVVDLWTRRRSSGQRSPTADD